VVDSGGSMRNRDQKAESLAFLAANAEIIEQVSTLLLCEAKGFMSVVGKRALLVDDFNRLDGIVDSGDIGEFAAALRRLPIAFSNVAGSNAYWHVIDAIGGYTDAIGTQWPYMTQDIRNERLVHAMEYADYIRASVGAFAKGLEADAPRATSSMGL